jgi:hypothetical protein
MQRKIITKTLAIVAAAIAVGAAPAAKAGNKGCSNASLYGTFADKDTGFIIPAANAAPVPFAGVNAITFDGKGNMTATGFGSVGGSTGAQTETGTYTVNSDCTGTYTVTVNPGAFTVHAYFVLDDSLDELQIIVTDPGNIITCIARKQFPIDDWRR